MRIKILARSFFEARMGTSRETELFRKYRIISINSVTFPAEPPAFSSRFIHSENLLVLFFDDVEEKSANAMTKNDARRIANFVRVPDPRPLLVHCTAGISRSGAVGEVLNWYYNRYSARNDKEFEQFARDNPDIVPNDHVRKTLLQVLTA